MPSWTFNLIGSIAGVLGALIVAWAMFGDPPRGRRRCPRCWYDMSGSPVPMESNPATCPECGRDCHSARALRLWRRRWKAAVVGGVVAIGPLYALPVVDRLPREKWWAFVPSTAAAFIVEVSSPDKGAPSRLERVLSRRSLAAWQQVILAWREPEPPRDSVERCVHMRRVIPVNAPLVVELRPDYRSMQSRWSSRTFTLETPAAPHDSAREWWARSGEFVCGMGRDPDRNKLVIPALPPGRASIDFKLRCNSDCDGWSVRAFERRVTVDVDVVDRIEDAITPVRSSDLDSQIHQAIQARIDWSPPGRMFIHLDLIDKPLPDHISGACTIDFVRNGASVGTCECSGANSYSLWYAGEASIRQPDHDQLWQALQRVGPGVSFRDATEGWSVRVTGSPMLALTELDKTHYWSGELTIDLGTLLVRGEVAK